VQNNRLYLINYKLINWICDIKIPEDALCKYLAIIEKTLLDIRYLIFLCLKSCQTKLSFGKT